MLELSEISKTYKVRVGNPFRPRYRTADALQDVNLTLRDGEILGILGPNGAGKSTLCKIAAGITKPTKGQALLDGEDITRNVREMTKKIGVVLGPTLIYHRLTGYQYLRFFAKLYDVRNYDERINHLCARLAIERSLGDRIEAYSLGMKMKISLVRALLHSPTLLVLDEFTMGLDPVSAKEVREMVQEMNTAVLLTTHNMVEAQKMARRIAFITKGKIAVIDTIPNILRVIQDKKLLVFEIAHTKFAREKLGHVKGAGSLHENEAGQFEMLVEEEELSSVLSVLATIDLRSVETRGPSLEEAYKYYTGERLTEG